MKGTKEFYEIMEQFEKEARNLFYGHRVEREARSEKHPNGVYYQDGYVNAMFTAFLAGYQYRKSVESIEQLHQQLHQDLAAAAEENANLLSRLHACQELSGVLPMSNPAALVGRLLLKRLSSFVDSGQAGLPIRLYFSATEAELLVDALRPLFGDAGAALKEKK